MFKKFFLTLRIMGETFLSLVRITKVQKLGWWTLLPITAIFILAIIFAFLELAPVLSPFVYPLF